MTRQESEAVFSAMRAMASAVEQAWLHRETATVDLMKAAFALVEPYGIVAKPGGGRS